MQHRLHNTSPSTLGKRFRPDAFLVRCEFWQTEEVMPQTLFAHPSLSKHVSLAGHSNLEFRWDVFNLFNHPGFGFPNANIGNASAGRITTTIVDNRSMQFALKLNS